MPGTRTGMPRLPHLQGRSLRLSLMSAPAS